MLLTITWDEEKARRNSIKHPGITFNEAETVFDSALSSTIPDPEHSQDERRLATLGYTRNNKLLRVSHTLARFYY